MRRRVRLSDASERATTSLPRLTELSTRVTPAPTSRPIAPSAPRSYSVCFPVQFYKFCVYVSHALQKKIGIQFQFRVGNTFIISAYGTVRIQHLFFARICV